MKREIPPPVIIAVLLLVLAGLGWFLWTKTDSEGNSERAARAQFEKNLEWARKHGIDPKTDPLLAPVYFKYHPEEKPAGGTPIPGRPAAGPPGGASTGAPPIQPPGPGGPPAGTPMPGRPPSPGMR